MHLYRSLVDIGGETFEKLKVDLFSFDEKLDTQDKIDMQIDRGDKGIFLLQVKTVNQDNFDV